MYVTLTAKHQPAVGRAKSRQRTLPLREWRSLHAADAIVLLRDLADDLEVEIEPESEPTNDRLAVARAQFSSQ